MASAKGTMNPGIQIKGTLAMKAVLGSFMKTRKGEGEERKPIKKTLTKSRIPKTFHNMAGNRISLLPKNRPPATSAVKPTIIS